MTMGTYLGTWYYSQQALNKEMNEIYDIHNQNASSKISVKLIDLYELGDKGTKVIIDFKLK